MHAFLFLHIGGKTLLDDFFICHFLKSVITFIIRKIEDISKRLHTFAYMYCNEIYWPSISNYPWSKIRKNNYNK